MIVGLAIEQTQMNLPVSLVSNPAAPPSSLVELVWATTEPTMKAAAMTELKSMLAVVLGIVVVWLAMSPKRIRCWIKS